MARNPDAPPPTRAQSISTFVRGHSDLVALAVGYLLGAGVALLGVLVGGR